MSGANDAYRWPAEGMTLMADVPPTVSDVNACFQHSPDWTIYRGAYQEAVALLVPEATDGYDYMLYPLLFCARQAIELGLKELIRILDGIAGADPRPVLTHSLSQLWQDVARASVEARIDLDEASEHFGRLVAELDELDQRSVRFRYPETRSGKPSYDAVDDSPSAADQGLPAFIDVEGLHAVLTAMFNYLDGSVDYFAAAAGDSW